MGDMRPIIGVEVGRGKQPQQLESGFLPDYNNHHQNLIMLISQRLTEP